MLDVSELKRERSRLGQVNLRQNRAGADPKSIDRGGLHLAKDLVDPLRVATLKLPNVVGDRRFESWNERAETLAHGCVDPRVERRREISRRQPTEAVDLGIESRSERQPVLAGEAEQGLVDFMLEQSVDTGR